MQAYTIVQVSKILKIPYHTVTRLINLGYLPSFNKGIAQKWVPAEAITEYQKSHTTLPKLPHVRHYGVTTCAKVGSPEYKRQRLLAAQELASMRGGVCLSVEYELKLKWQCAQAHQWLASMAVVKRGTWCKECACKVSLA